MADQPDPEDVAPDPVIEVLLERYGRTYTSEAGIRLERNTPSPLFELLCLSLLISARISADAAVSAARALWEAGWTTADAMAGATWQQRTKVLNSSGYARYDESTSRYLADTAELVSERWNGDLRELRGEADGDPEVLREGLLACKGIGEVGADVFMREVQTVWSEYVPFADERSLEAAGSLGLPTSGDGLVGLVGGDPEEFAGLVAALVRVGLAGDFGSVLEATEVS